MENRGQFRLLLFADMINRGLTVVVHNNISWCARKCENRLSPDFPSHSRSMPRERQKPESRIFPSQLALLLAKNHMSTRQAATAWGLDNAHVHRLMTGKFVVTAATVATICSKLGNPEDRASLTEAFLTDELEKLRRDLGIVWSKNRRKGGGFVLKPGGSSPASAP